MLSNPTSNLQTRQRQHRRQNSTPTAFEGIKIAGLPNLQRQTSHRRGMSLDQHRRRKTPPQEFSTVSNTNTQGYQTTPQHILRETQQHRPARPGRIPNGHHGNEDTYLHSPLATPQRQSFDLGSVYGQPTTPYAFSEPISEGSPFEITDFRSSTSSNFSLYSTGSMTPSAFLEDFANHLDADCGVPGSGYSSKRSSFGGRRISGGIAERVNQFETMALQHPPHHRPMTPPGQNAVCKKPHPRVCVVANGMKHITH